VTTLCYPVEFFPSFDVRLLCFRTEELNTNSNCLLLHANKHALSKAVLKGTRRRFVKGKEKVDGPESEVSEFCIAHDF
jgi:hypothetical protein